MEAFTQKRIRSRMPGPGGGSVYNKTQTVTHVTSGFPDRMPGPGVASVHSKNAYSQ